MKKVGSIFHRQASSFLFLKYNCVG